MACSHQVSFCSLHGCEKCGYKGHEEDCPYAVHDDSSELCPTFAEMLEIYSSAGSAAAPHKRNVVALVKLALAELGMTVDAKASMMTRTKFKTLIRLLTSPVRPASRGNPDGGPLSDATVASYLGAFRSISSDLLEDAYEAHGIDLPALPIPRFEVRHKPVQEVSDRVARLVEVQMERWLASGSESDRSAFVLTFFALYCGMRVGDICSLKWDVFQQTSVGLMVVYTPHKSITRKRPHGKKVSFRLDNRVYCKIEPLVGKPDEYVIPRHENRTGAGTKKDGAFCGMHVYLRRKVNRALEACGIGTEFRQQKKAHALRKYFATDRELGHGDGAAAIGDTRSVAGNYYIGSLIGKVS